LYQAVSNSTSNNASNGGTLNPGEPRNIPQSAYSPIVRSNSSPNLRTSAPVTPLASPRPLLDASPNAATQKTLLSRTLSLQNLSTEDQDLSASATPAPVSPSNAAFSLLPHTTVAKRRQHASSFFPASPGTVMNSLFFLPNTLSPSEDNSIPCPEANQVVAPKAEEEDYATYFLDEDLELESSDEVCNPSDSVADTSSAPNTVNSSCASNPLVPTSVNEWFAEPSDSLTEDVVVLPVSPKRRVSFDPIASVILIPTKEEYYAAGLHTDLWYRGQEMRRFKQDAYREVQALMRQENIVHVKEAFRRLSINNESDVIASNTHRNTYSHSNFHAPEHEEESLPDKLQVQPLQRDQNVLFAQSLSLVRHAAVSGNLQQLGISSV
jgi:hypothetical protein